MKHLRGGKTAGMCLLILEIIKDMDMPKLRRALIETRCRIAVEWRGYPKGLKIALDVFDDMCLDYRETHIAVRRNITRERVRQIRGNLSKLKCVQELKQKLRDTKSAGE